MTTTVNVSVKLSDLSDEAFDDIVNQDVRETLDVNISALLREPENVERWHDMLLTLKRRVEIQLSGNRGEQAAKQAEFLSLGPAGKQSWLRYRASNEKWRQGAIRFKNGVEDKLAEAKRLRSNIRGVVYADHVVTERNRALDTANQLRAAIILHRKATEAETDDQDDIDQQLWELAESG